MIGTIVHDFTVDDNQGGRNAGTFKDGQFIRAVVIYPANLIRFFDMEGHQLYEDAALVGQHFIITDVSAETSSFGTPHVVLGISGFTPDTKDSRLVILSTDYQVAPPAF